jgi:AcrR family transcriptional regulator
MRGPKISYRQRQAQATRRAIALAARTLFAERGYDATTIDAISAACGIPIPTIYSALGSKPAILEEARLVWIEEAEVTSLYAEAMQLENGTDRLRMAAHWTRRQFELGIDVITAYQEAARSDPRAARVWREALAGRERAVRELVMSLGPGLRPRLTVDRGLDLYIAVTLPEIYRTLTERGWTPDDYELWLWPRLASELLRD